jgi:hypothetical protein
MGSGAEEEMRRGDEVGKSSFGKFQVRSLSLAHFVDTDGFGGDPAREAR